MAYFCDFHSWHSTGTAMCSVWKWVMVPQGYSLLSSNKYRHTLAGKHNGRNLLFSLATLHYNQALSYLIWITVESRVDEDVNIVGSWKIKSLLQVVCHEDFHKTLSMVKDLTDWGSEVACWRSCNRSEAELLGESKTADSLWPSLLNRSKEKRLILPWGMNNLSRLTAGINQPNPTKVNRDAFIHATYR